MKVAQVGSKIPKDVFISLVFLGNSLNVSPTTVRPRDFLQHTWPEHLGHFVATRDTHSFFERRIQFKEKLHYWHKDKEVVF